MNKKFLNSKIISTIMGTVALFFIVAIFSGVTIINAAASSFMQDSMHFSKEVEKTAQLIGQHATQKTKTLESYCIALKNLQASDTTAISYILQQAASETDFIGLALLLENKEPVLSSNFSAEIINTEILQQTLAKNQATANVFATQTHLTVYTVPVQIGGENAYLVGTVSARYQDAMLQSEIFNNKMQLYVVDQNNTVAYFCGNQGKKFDYTTVPKESFFVADESYFKKFNEALSEQGTDTMLADSFANSAKEIMAITKYSVDGSKILWFEQEILPNENTVWRLVVGRPSELSAQSEQLLFMLTCLIGVLLLIFFLVMIAIIILQGCANRKLLRVAYQDTVTKSYNWHKFVIETQRTIRRVRGQKYTLVALDIRKFRVISDMDGYYNSDEILRKLACVLAKNLKRKEFFTRYAADEFVVLAKYTEKDQLIERICQIDADLKQQLAVKNLSLVYGVFHIEDYNMPVARIYNYACIAKDSIKNNREECIGVFSSNLRDNILRENEIETHMQAALENGEFCVYLQPKYSADGKKVVGAEALVRWLSPEMGFISPAEFIPLFETNGFIRNLDYYMLDKVSQYQQKWLQQNKELTIISVNMSRINMQNPNLAENIAAIIDKYSVPHSCIELELTESAFFDDKNAILQNIIALQEKGFLISMDDFGSGYSSLNSLKDLPLDIVKLDCEFFNKSDNQKRSETVITDTIRLAKHLNMKIVAEGIETKEQVEFLYKIGCDSIQGYYFAKPMPVPQFEQLMGYVENA